MIAEQTVPQSQHVVKFLKPFSHHWIFRLLSYSHSYEIKQQCLKIFCHIFYYCLGWRLFFPDCDSFWDILCPWWPRQFWGVTDHMAILFLGHRWHFWYGYSQIQQFSCYWSFELLPFFTIKILILLLQMLCFFPDFIIAEDISEASLLFLSVTCHTPHSFIFLPWRVRLHMEPSLPHFVWAQK